MRPLQPRFNVDDAQRAFDAWGCNCGPGAVAAIMGLSLNEVRPIMSAAGFDAKRYTNPTMMNNVLRAVGRPWRKIGATWPDYGLVRVQWEGPWTAPGVPMRVRYQHTHWIGAAISNGDIGVFDINCVNNGSGWLTLSDWEAILVPWLLKETTPKASGKWHITHAIEVEPLSAMAA